MVAESRVWMEIVFSLTHHAKASPTTPPPHLHRREVSMVGLGKTFSVAQIKVGVCIRGRGETMDYEPEMDTI